ncbi:MAG: energy-coupling factor ABC transporter ATP-binding protein [Syntrophothermus sp.]
MLDPILEIRNLRFTYPDGTVALRGVDLEVRAGETVALLGPNGAGKSTLLLNLNGILRGEGFIRVAGEVLEERNLRRIRQKVGLVFQNPDDQLFMIRAYDDVAFGPANAGLPAAEVEDRVKQALGQVGLAGYEERAPYHLSSGEKKRLSIATVLSMDIELLVLDEPSSNLDPRARRQLINLLRELKSADFQGRKLTQIIATHDLALVWELCPRSVILDGGKVVADGPTTSLLRDQTLLERHGLELPGMIF